MQGIHEFIPTSEKARYINQLLKVGFDTIDFGSFVSPKAIPQMKDTANVLEQLEMETSKSKLLAIVANYRGATDACMFEGITYLGFPFSVSETFQKRNTNKSIAASLKEVEMIQDLCEKKDKQLVIYISMGFGNPYGDPWDVHIVEQWVQKLTTLGIKTISLADTVGVAKPADIEYLFKNLIPALPEITFGAHLHASPDDWEPKVEAAYHSGCRRFDAAIKGFGGCPMAKDELVGNMATENLARYFDGQNEGLGLDLVAFQSAQQMALEIF